jgi:hypothetical protein
MHCAIEPKRITKSTQPNFRIRQVVKHASANDLIKGAT